MKMASDLCAEMVFMSQIPSELDQAKKEFPSNKHQLAALGEEVGELQQALIEHDMVGNVSAGEVWDEALQVAVMALRVATEGDESFNYDPKDAVEQTA